MTDALHEFFCEMTPVAREEVAWLGGTIRLRLEAYLTQDLPPLAYVTSVRAVLVTEAGCAVLRNADGVHVLPGGRREAHEEIRETLCREIEEETGCSVTSAQRLGLLHFQHLTAKPAGYEYPYPDFVQAVFAARGTRGSFMGDSAGYERALEFRAPSELDATELPEYQRLLVKAALRALG